MQFHLQGEMLEQQTCPVTIVAFLNQITTIPHQNRIVIHAFWHRQDSLHTLRGPHCLTSLVSTIDKFFSTSIANTKNIPRFVMLAFPEVLFWLRAQRTRSGRGFGKRACVFYESLSHEGTVVHSVFITLLWTFLYRSHITFLLKRIFKSNYINLHVVWNKVISSNFYFATRFKSHAE